MTKDRAILILKMMSSPVRLSILKALVEYSDGICVGKIEEILELPQSNVSQHLAHLRNSGILGCKKTGKRVCYKILDDSVINIVKSLNITEEE